MSNVRLYLLDLALVVDDERVLDGSWLHAAAELVCRTGDQEPINVTSVELREQVSSSGGWPVVRFFGGWDALSELITRFAPDDDDRFRTYRRYPVFEARRFASDDVPNQVVGPCTGRTRTGDVSGELRLSELGYDRNRGVRNE